MAYTYTELTAAIRDYTEVGDSVFTQAVIDNFILSAEHRINIDCPMDSDRFVDQGTMVADVNNIRVPGGALFIRGVEVFNTANSTEAGTWLEKKDQTYLAEYIGRETGPEGNLTGQDVTGKPKYYAMFGGATGLTDTTSGSIYLAPTPVNCSIRFKLALVFVPQVPAFSPVAISSIPRSVNVEAIILFS